ncbi:glycosyltransferase [uncultured Mucilaginibacter sp.]|uniref:glycosyltransferase n=1 Tax=uncultured Mucilaginibacter sp. TaxID=797541 RepID=UPI0025EE3012|nr:glycosyltransferase [uncultured Mucilaginibacter sp.]
MKLAIVQDELIRKGGAEQVVLSFHKAFPEAPIYTLAYNRDKTYAEFKNCNIITSWFNKFVHDAHNLKRFFFPFGIMAMQQLKVKGYDVILQSTTHCAKYVDTEPNALIITYCHTPFRLAWRPNSYGEISSSKGLKRQLYSLVVNILKKIDKKSALKTDWFITNAKEVVPRIEEAYQPQNPITIINPPVKCSNFYISDKIPEYYLVVSRLESYKKVDLVIEAFNKMPEKKLLVVGKGSMKKQLRALANTNITFAEGLNAEELSKAYAESKALIFPQHEDYGITPLEANASGRPVIAYGKGGVIDTMIPYNNNAMQATALFFENQHVDDISSAITQFEELSFDPEFIREHAKRFDEIHFVKHIQEFVKRKFNESKSIKTANH